MDRRAVAWIVVASLLLAGSSARAQAPPAAPGDTLTLREALQSVLLQNPELRAFSLEVRAAEARRLQAEARPNPRLGFEAENFGGTLPISDPELTLSLAQLVQLGGKRRARVDVAHGETEVAQLDYEAARLELLFETQRRFLEALAAERLLDLTRESVGTAAEVLRAVQLKVRAGGTSPAEATRSEVELATAQLGMELQREKANLARSRLAALWGAPRATFRAVAGTLDSLAALPNLDTLLVAAAQSPEIERWNSEVRVRAARLARARAERVPDLDLLAGYRALLGSDDHTFVAGLSLPLPLFDRNRGGIEDAEISTSKSSEQLASATLSRRLQIVEAYSVLSQERIQIEALRNQVIPGAARAYSELRLGFERGRFGYLDLLEARRTWTAAEREELLSLLTFHATLAELEWLTGGRASAAPPGGSR